MKKQKEAGDGPLKKRITWTNETAVELGVDD